MTAVEDVPKNWSRISWNRVSFICPQSWQPLEVGQRYLVLEDKDGPVMEVKWGPVKGRFSHKTQLKKLASMHQRKLAKTLEPCELPPKWAKSVKRFDASAFSWHGDDAGAKGLLLYCPDCRNASILQFFKEGAAPSRVLERFRDHLEGGFAAWSLFDIYAETPDQFQLTSHSFLPGKFSLSFSSDSSKLHLYRYSPASVLLANGGLEGFSRSVFSNLPGEPKFSRHMGREAVEFEKLPGEGVKGVLDKLKIKGAWARYRLWHLEKENRILAVVMEGRKAESDLFDQISAHYEIT